MRALFTLATIAIVALACTSVRALEGGYKDPNTGKVWSQNYWGLNYGSSVDWAFATSFAANYEISDYNAQGVWTLYSDWRLPTITELQTACANGTINNLATTAGYIGGGHYTGVWGLWSSTTQGSGKKRRAYFMSLTFQNGVLTAYEARLPYPGEWPNSYFDFFMIRP